MKNCFKVSFLVVCLMLIAFVRPEAASAATKGYSIKAANTPVYSDTKCTVRFGTIFASDEITFNLVTANYCKVTYNITGSSKRKTGYVKTNTVLTKTGGDSYIARAKVTTYRRASGQTYGYVSKGDKVQILGKSGNYTQIKYPVSNNGFKYAFIKTVDYNNSIAPLKSSLALSSVKVPGEMTEGSNLNVTGKAASNYNITGVSVSLYRNNSYVSGKSVQINSKSYDLSKMGISFKGLKAGQYTYIIAVKDSSGKKISSRWSFSVKSAAAGVGTPKFPDSRAKEVTNAFTNSQGKRSKANYDRVINQFKVETTERYKRTSTSTFCNIFAWDVMSAMNVSLPHWTYNNTPVKSGTKGAKELTANATYDWLRDYGSKYGWKRVNASTAQNRANKGYPTIAIWKNSNTRKSGHIMVVRPEGNGYEYKKKNSPVIAQAGATNRNYWYVVSALGSKNCLYYTHD